MSSLKKLFSRNRIELVLLVVLAIACSKKSSGEYKSNTICEEINSNVDSTLFNRDRSKDSISLKRIESCELTNSIIQVKLDMLSELDMNNEAVEFLNSLTSENFKNQYDSLVYKNFFLSRLSPSTGNKLSFYKNITDHMILVLEESPTDTLALSNYCQYALYYLKKKEVFKTIDSLSVENRFDPTYAFVISLYLPDYLNEYMEKSRIFRRKEIHEI